MPLDDYKLLIEYITGERKIFDVKPYIKGEWYGELIDEDTFKPFIPAEPPLNGRMVRIFLLTNYTNYPYRQEVFKCLQAKLSKKP